jgi:hypothetical protein
VLFDRGNSWLDCMDAGGDHETMTNEHEMIEGYFRFQVVYE